MPVTFNVALPGELQVALLVLSVLVWVAAIPDTAKNIVLGKGALEPPVVTFVKAMLSIFLNRLAQVIGISR